MTGGVLGEHSNHDDKATDNQQETTSENNTHYIILNEYTENL